MPLARVATKTLLLAAGFALLLRASAQAQDPPIPRKPDTAVVTTYRDTIRGGIPKEELPKAREAFKTYAKYIAALIAHPALWKPQQDIKADPNARSLTLEGSNGIFHDLDKFILAPVPGGPKSGNFEPDAYIREMGAALDAALRDLMENHPERLVRLNAARTLAHVARSGAPAHFQTVTALLANPKTGAEIKYYLLHAAAALLDALDPADMKLRKHAADPKTVGALVKTVQDYVTNPGMILPGYKPELVTDEQLQVVGLVRRQAVRALAKVKFVMIDGPDSKTPVLYPSYTLVRVAMGDPALTPAPGPADCAEAVIGLCNMAPVERQGDNFVVAVKNFNADVAVEAITQGLVTFAAPRATDRDDRSVPWRSYALRIAEALYKYQPLYDPFFNFLQPNKFDAKLVPASLKELYRFVVPKVLYPLEKVDNKGVPVEDPDVPGLRGLLDRMKANPKRKTVLFDGVKETSIDFAAPKK
jgi:hypothetical protein